MSGEFTDQFSCHNEMSREMIRKMLRQTFHGKFNTPTVFISLSLNRQNKRLVRIKDKSDETLSDPVEPFLFLEIPFIKTKKFQE